MYVRSDEKPLHLLGGNTIKHIIHLRDMISSTETDVLMYSTAAQYFDEFVFSDPTTNKKGGKSVYLYRSETIRTPPRIQLCADGEQKLRAPFGANSYEDNSTSRMNLAFAIENENLLHFFEELDLFIQKVAVQQCQPWFKKTLTEAEVNSMYRPCLTPSEKGYAPLIRTKVNMTAPNQVRVWRAQGNAVVEGTPADITRTARYMPVITLQGCWFLSRQTGLTMTCTDLMVFPDTSKIFPFRTALQPTDADTSMDGPDEVTPEEAA
jgi:hypothetical protein